MKSVLKIMKQPPRVVPPKTAVHATNNKKAKYLRNTHEGAHLHPNDRQTACSFTGNEPPQEFPKYT